MLIIYLQEGGLNRVYITILDSTITEYMKFTILQLLLLCECASITEYYTIINY